MKTLIIIAYFLFSLSAFGQEVKKTDLYLIENNDTLLKYTYISVDKYSIPDTIITEEYSNFDYNNEDLRSKSTILYKKLYKMCKTGKFLHYCKDTYLVDRKFNDKKQKTYGYGYLSTKYGCSDGGYDTILLPYTHKVIKIKR